MNKLDLLPRPVRLKMVSNKYNAINNYEVEILGVITLNESKEHNESLIENPVHPFDVIL